jgi:hypothetical protein
VTRSGCALLLVLLAASTAAAKYICPPGRFVLHIAGQGMAVLEGAELELGKGWVSLPGGCAAASGRRFLDGMDRWLNSIRTDRMRCDRGTSVRMRARFAIDGPYCAWLEGTLRTGRGRRIPFVAERIPACGNGLRETGEQCDGTASAAWGTCCADDCTVKPGCPVQCDQDRFLCVAPEICTYTCGFEGVCQAPERIDCASGPVCGCDNTTTYPDRCAAFAAGTGVSYAGACRQPVAAPAPR